MLPGPNPVPAAGWRPLLTRRDPAALIMRFELPAIQPELAHRAVWSGSARPNGETALGGD